MLILDVFRIEISRVLGEENLKDLNHTLGHERLISRDDKNRYESEHDQHGAWGEIYN